MDTKTKIFVVCVAILIFVLLPIKVTGNIQDSQKEKYENTVSVVVKTFKKVYEPNEPIPLIMAIANHSSKPIYVYRTLSDFFEGLCSVKDAKNKNVRGGPLPEKPWPYEYYMQKEGKSTIVYPVYKIDEHGVMIAIIEDAIKLHRQNMSEGMYYIGSVLIGIYHDVNDIIEREDVPVRFWIDPKNNSIPIEQKSNNVQIEIRKKPEIPKGSAIQTTIKTPTPLAETQPFAWPAFSIGAAVGFCALGLILLLMKKSKPHQP